MPTKSKSKKTPKADEKVADLLVGFVIDRSGSMNWLSEATVGGFNEFLSEQRAQNDGSNLYVSTLLFDDAFDVRHVAEPIDLVPPMTLGPGGPNGYWTGNSTALYDASATMITGIDAWLASHPNYDGNVMVAVLTDGAENASHRTSLAELNALIGERRTRGWHFAFLGTGGSAWLEGASFSHSIGQQNTVRVPASARGQRIAYASLSTNSSMLRGTSTAMTADAAYAAADSAYDDSEDASTTLAGDSQS